jgi:hypothetical protein
MDVATAPLPTLSEPEEEVVDSSQALTRQKRRRLATEELPPDLKGLARQQASSDYEVEHGWAD